jgi:hypothetical protein
VALRRGGWAELDLDDESEAMIMAHPGWTNDRETLILGIRETGWFPTTGEAMRAAEAAELKWGWIGVTDESTVVICDSDGIAVGTGEKVVDVSQVTLARITSSP